MLCPGCFHEKTSALTCLHCGYDESIKRSLMVLPHHTRLNQGHYRLGRVLGKPGGFGITYLGWDERLQTKVAIKEYLPRELAGRDADHRTVAAHSGEDADAFAFGLGKFLEEARTLARLDHPNLVRVRDFFEENGTAYLVMDYYDGLTLAEYLTRQPGSKLPEDQAIGILLPILDGLREVHAKGFLHRDIKPANIYLTAANRPILLDFGAARQAMGEHSRSLSVVLSAGYAPIEQYQRNGKQGPWTDVYGAAATLYAMVTGQPPPDATDRIEIGSDTLPGLDGVDPALARAIRRGLIPSPADRPRDMESFQALFTGPTDPHPLGTAPTPPEQAPAASSLATPRNLWGIVTTVLLVLILAQAWERQPPAESRPAWSPVLLSPDEPTPMATVSPAIPPTPVIMVQADDPPPPVDTRPAAVRDGERIRRLMEEQDGDWGPERYRRAALAFHAALRSDSARRAEWRRLLDFAQTMATTTSRWHFDRPMPGAAGQRQAIHDGERVRVKMRVAQGVWSADRYRRAQAAFRAAAEADPIRRDLWESESRYAQTMRMALEARAPEPSPPLPLVPTTPARSLTPAARQAIVDGERVLKKMIEKDGEWTAIRYGKAMAAFKAAAKADSARRRDWQKAIEYAARMADKGDN